MRVTRESLIRIVKETVQQRVFNDRGIVAAYLTGSLVQKDIEPMVGGTTDIDIIIVHADEPKYRREFVKLTETLEAIESAGHVVFRYADGAPNGALNDIAGVTNAAGNVVGLMPHPEHAVDEVLDGTDGRSLFASAALWVAEAGERRRA